MQSGARAGRISWKEEGWLTRFRDYMIQTYLMLDGLSEPMECGWRRGGPVIPVDLLPPRIVYEGRLTMRMWRGKELVHSDVGQPISFVLS